MLFDWNTIAAPAALLDVQLSAPRTLTGEGPAPGTEAVHLPLETRQTHSPSPERVSGAESWMSCTAAGEATAFQSNSNI